MLPYYPMRPIELFGLPPLQPFGLLVVTGILVGSWFAHRRAREAKIPAEEITSAIRWAVGMGFVFAHLVDIIFYHPERITEKGFWEIFKIWDGISSFGGFFGAFVGLTLYFQFILKKRWLTHAEVILQALIPGWVFGRLGCTLAHDHPGRLTHFFLAFNYPGGARHNLGFYEFLLTLLVLLPMILWIHTRNPRPGTYLAAVALVYAPVRFGLDFLRATDTPVTDARYLGLTPAQYAALALFSVGMGIVVLQRRNQLGDKAPKATVR